MSRSTMLEMIREHGSREQLDMARQYEGNAAKQGLEESDLPEAWAR